MEDRNYSYKILQDIDLSGNSIKRVSSIGTNELSVNAAASVAVNSPKFEVESTNIGVKSSSISIDNAEEILAKANSYVNTSSNVKSNNDSMIIDSDNVNVNSKNLSIEGEGVAITSGKESVIHSSVVEFDTLKTYAGKSGDNLKIEFDPNTSSLIFSVI